MDTINTVFILGAGASKDAGAPLMGNFLDEADKLWKSARVEKDWEHFNRVFRQIGQLQSVHSKSKLDLVNIESVFATFEMAGILKRLPGVEGRKIDEEVEKCLKSLRHLIVRTLEEKMRFDKMPNGAILPNKTYNLFAWLLYTLQRSVIPQHSVSIITFNYDVALEHAFYCRHMPVAYALDASSSDDAIPILKLHGSLNWGKCEKCKKIVPVSVGDYLSKTGNLSSNINHKTAALNIGSYLQQVRHDCGQNLMVEPVLVPPTWNKTDHHRTLSTVWQKAAQVLSEAQNIFVIGYSMPESDAFFRQLYALGSVGSFPLQKFWVFNPDSSGVVTARFEEIMGSGARDRFKSCRKTFVEAIPIIGLEFLEEGDVPSFLKLIEES